MQKDGDAMKERQIQIIDGLSAEIREIQLWLANEEARPCRDADDSDQAIRDWKDKICRLRTTRSALETLFTGASV